MNLNKQVFTTEWTKPISNIEHKLKIALMIAQKAKDGDVIGFGSGSSAYLAVVELGKRVREENLKIKAVPTSHEIRYLCISLGIPITSIDQDQITWGFDGADEVGPNNWLIKGRGGAMLKEKIVMASSPLTYILVDDSKFVDRLGEKYPIPVECLPAATTLVIKELEKLGATEIKLRPAEAKDGPTITENGNFILDVRFNEVTETLERDIKSIVGVVESGLFIDYNIKIIS